MNASTTEGHDILVRVIDIRADREVHLAIGPFGAEDVACLDRPEWLGSVFKEAWRQLGGHPSVHALRHPNAARDILGMVMVGRVKFPGGPLEENLIEAAPVCIHGAPDRWYAGVGRALTAWLALMSQEMGGSGVLVRARSGTPAVLRASRLGER